MSTTPTNARVEAAAVIRRRRVESLRIIRDLLRIRLAVVGLAILFICVVCAIFAPQIAPYDPYETRGDRLLLPAMRAHLLGTDHLGRDTLSRLIFGARVALVVSVGAIGLSTVVGMPMGLIAGYSRGWIDAVTMRICDALVSYPSLVLATAFVGVLGPTITNVVVAIGIAHVPWIARVVRSQALSVREHDYVTAARSLGARTPRVLFLHVWPNCTAPVIVQGSLGMAYAVLTEAGLGFLGVGIQVPTPTWGNMLQYAFGYLAQDPILSIAPGVAIFLLVLGFNFVGDALRDVLDPRLRGVIH